MEIMSSKLQDIEAMVGQLDLTDQVRLLEYLAPKIAGNVLQRTANPLNPDAAWHRFREVGHRLAHSSHDGTDSLTESISKARR
jgi:hypothetical protein